MAVVLRTARTTLKKSTVKEVIFIDCHNLVLLMSLCASEWVNECIFAEYTIQADPKPG